MINQYKPAKSNGMDLFLVRLNCRKTTANYDKCWNAEMLFNVCKSYRRLTSECRSMPCDIMTAYVSIVFARDMILTVGYRIQTNKSKENLGEMFYHLCDELPDIT